MQNQFHSFLTMEAPIQIRPQRLFSEKDYAVILLNRDITISDELFMTIWNNASIRQVVDGGSNHFFNFLDKLPHNAKENLKFPEIASGDFDSITEESMKRLKDDGRCKIVVTESQVHKDFAKGLVVLRNHVEAEEFTQKLTKVIVICECTGRLDLTIANLNILHKNVFHQDSTVGVYLLGLDNVTFIFPANRQVSMTFEEENPDFMCAVLPLMGPTKLTSQGFEWELTLDKTYQYGGPIRVGNFAIRKNVEIISYDKHTLFTLVIKESQYVPPAST